MDSLRWSTLASWLPRSRVPMLCGVLTLAPASSACRHDDTSGKANMSRVTATPTASFSPSSLRVPPEQLSRIEISRQGAPELDRRIVLEKAEDGWSIVSPIDSPANQRALDPIVAVLAEIEITAASAGDEDAARTHRVDRATGIEVKAWVGDHLQSHFLVGRSTREETFVKRVDDPRILTVRGRCHPVFDRTLEQLRHPVITSFSATDIVGVKYTNPFGTIELVPDPKEPGRFISKGASIRNFDVDRATKDVGVLANLRAQGFVDAPATLDVTGLFKDDTPRATLLLRDERGSRSLDVWVGARTTEGRLYLRTSQSKQIYLVSSHLETSLLPRKSHFERTDEMMRQLEAHRDKRAREVHGGTSASTHTHGLPKAPPTQVPTELLRDLRVLARQQRASR